MILDPPRAAFEARWQRLHARMRAARLDALLVGSAPSLQWLTGYRPPLIVSSARPWLAVLPIDHAPSLCVASLAAADARRLGHAASVAEWASPARDEGLAEALALLAVVPRRHGRLGLELGDHARLGFPAGWLARLAAAGWELADAACDLWALRMVKDGHEVAAIRAACDAAAAGFRAVPGSVGASAIGAGVAETDVARAFAVAALAGGADEVGYVAVGSGPGGADSGVRRPSARRFAPGDHLLIDAGVLVGGYWCDLNRNFAVGRPATHLHDAAGAVRDAAAWACTMLRPSLAASDAWRLLAARLDEAGHPVPRTGRLGHGVGLEFTERPSLAPTDHTPLVAGMTLALEPTVLIQGDAGQATVVPYEEVVLVTSSGVEPLSTPADSALLVCS